MVNGALGPTGVVNFEPIAKTHHVIAHGLQAVGRFLCQQGRGFGLGTAWVGAKYGLGYRF